MYLDIQMDHLRKEVDRIFFFHKIVLFVGNLPLPHVRESPVPRFGLSMPWNLFIMKKNTNFKGKLNNVIHIYSFDEMGEYP